MSTTGSIVTVATPVGPDPLSCTEFGYGLGEPDGILVLKYRSGGRLEFGESRQDFLHQFYWSPDGVLATRRGTNLQYIDRSQAFWAERAVSHEVWAGDRQTIYRVYLREVPTGVVGLRCGPVSFSEESARLLESIAAPGRSTDDALAARLRIMAGMAATGTSTDHNGGGPGFALRVARALTQDPADQKRLDEWATELHISVKTLQRDFVREFGLPFTQWRTDLRLQLARVLVSALPVSEVAQRVGYASSSAFVSAFAKQFGYTPGRHSARQT